MEDSGIKRTVNGRLHPARYAAGISAANYYLLVGFSAAVIFFVVLAALYDGLDDLPWVVAGISAITFTVSLILFREIVLRAARQRNQAAAQLSLHLRAARRLRRDAEETPKLSLQHIEAMVREIRAKSDAAKVLGKLADAHREVFELCDEYLMIAAEELRQARAGSPRIPALRKGSATATKRHRTHMLKWAEIKARSFSEEVSAKATLAEKIASAGEALAAVETAVHFYPGEPALEGSKSLLKVFLASARVKASIESAESEDAAGNRTTAVEHYRNALEELNRCDVEFPDRESVEEKIMSEIGRISRAPDFRL